MGGREGLTVFKFALLCSVVVVNRWMLPIFPSITSVTLIQPVMKTDLMASRIRVAWSLHSLCYPLFINFQYHIRHNKSIAENNSAYLKLPFMWPRSATQSTAQTCAYLCYKLCMCAWHGIPVAESRTYCSHWLEFILSNNLISPSYVCLLYHKILGEEPMEPSYSHDQLFLLGLHNFIHLHKNITTPHGG